MEEAQKQPVPRTLTQELVWRRGLFLAEPLQLLAEHQRFQYRLHWQAASNAAASNAAAFSSSLDGGELFSRIQDRGDQAFTERGREPMVTRGFVFAPHLGIYRSVSGPARSLNHCFEAPAGFCTWGMKDLGVNDPAFLTHLRAGSSTHPRASASSVQLGVGSNSWSLPHPFSWYSLSLPFAEGF